MQDPRISARIQRGFIFAVWTEEVTIQPIMLDDNYQYFGHTLDFAHSPRFVISHAHRYWFFYHFSILIMNDISFIPFLCSCFVVSHQKRSSKFFRQTHNPQFLHSLWRRANARNICFETLNSGQLTLSSQLIAPNYLVILSHRCSTTVSLETYPLYSEIKII